MSPDISCLQSRYYNSCKKYDVKLNPRVLSWFHQEKIEKSFHQERVIVVLLDYLKDIDLYPLVDTLEAVECSSDIDAVDIIHQEKCNNLNKEFIWCLICSLKSKLRVLQLGDSSLVNDFLSDSSMNGLSCQVINFKSSTIRELKIEGKFKQLHTLNLDFCTSLKNISEDCFASVPNLVRLSMCETSVANLWAVTAALSKLRTLVELRFQNCLCCDGTGACPVLGKEISKLDFKGMKSGNFRTSSAMEQSADPNEVSFRKIRNQDLPDSPTSVINPNFNDTFTPTKKYTSSHPSPICFKKHYRDFIIDSLPSLSVLDNLQITNSEKEKSKTVISENYERFPYKERVKQSVVTLLHHREGGTSRINSMRSICSAKLGLSTRPLLRSVSSECHVSKEERKNLKPRQFEFHQSDPSLMVFGTMDGEIVVINHENKNIVGYVSSLGDNSVLGLCWLKKYPNLFLAGSDNGSLRLYDINNMHPKTAEEYANPCSVTFNNFDQLTSVHVNSTDDKFLASGCSGNVAIYDIDSSKCVQLFNDMHKGPINVAKFANHSPSMFATSSFDRDVKMWDVRQNPVRPCYTVSSFGGNVMVCFSPDDHHLLVSAVNNEVKQLMAADGRQHLKFDIASSGSIQNYTRSYYMNGRDYIISGSSDESVVRICCAQTGRRLRDVYLEVEGSSSSMFVQTLRGDPFRHFEMAVLANTTQPRSKSEIIKINLLSSADKKEYHSGHKF